MYFKNLESNFFYMEKILREFSHEMIKSFTLEEPENNHLSYDYGGEKLIIPHHFVEVIPSDLICLNGGFKLFNKHNGHRKYFTSNRFYLSVFADGGIMVYADNQLIPMGPDRLYNSPQDAHDVTEFYKETYALHDPQELIDFLHYLMDEQDPDPEKFPVKKMKLHEVFDSYAIQVASWKEFKINSAEEEDMRHYFFDHEIHLNSEIPFKKLSQLSSSPPTYLKSQKLTRRLILEPIDAIEEEVRKFDFLTGKDVDFVHSLDTIYNFQVIPSLWTSALIFARSSEMERNIGFKLKNSTSITYVRDSISSLDDEGQNLDWLLTEIEFIQNESNQRKYVFRNRLLREMHRKTFSNWVDSEIRVDSDSRLSQFFLDYPTFSSLQHSLPKHKNVPYFLYNYYKLLIETNNPLYKDSIGRMLLTNTLKFLVFVIFEELIGLEHERVNKQRLIEFEQNFILSSSSASDGSWYTALEALLNLDYDEIKSKAQVFKPLIEALEKSGWVLKKGKKPPVFLQLIQSRNSASHPASYQDNPSDFIQLAVESFGSLFQIIDSAMKGITTCCVLAHEQTEKMSFVDVNSLSGNSKSLRWERIEVNHKDGLRAFPIKQGQITFIQERTGEEGFNMTKLMSGDRIYPKSEKPKAFDAKNIVDAMVANRHSRKPSHCVAHSSRFMRLQSSSLDIELFDRMKDGVMHFVSTQTKY